MSINDPRTAPDYSTSSLPAAVATAVGTINTALIAITSGIRAAPALDASRALNALCGLLRSLPVTTFTVSWRTTGSVTSGESVSGVQRTTGGGASQWYAVDHQTLRDEQFTINDAGVLSALGTMWFFITANVGKYDVRPAVEAFWLTVKALKDANV